MSFSGNSLDQGARLDRKTFMNNSQSRSEYSQEDSPPRRGGVPLSYAYGAPTLAKPPTQTSPNRHPSPTRSTTSSIRNRSGRSVADHTPDHEDDQISNISYASTTVTGQEPGAVRYARLKQRNLALGTSSYHPSGPGIIISPPNGANLRDTSVNVATAFHQAASNTMPSTGQPVQTRRIAAPPSKVRKPNSAASNRSAVDESIDRSVRAKSPLLETLASAGQAIARAVSPNTTYLLKEPLFQPMRVDEPPAKTVSRQDTKASTVPSNDSYDYEAEERMVRGEAPMPSSTKHATHQRRKSTTSTAARLAKDNKAYQPSDDEEDDDDDFSDENTGRRRKKKKKEDGKSSLSLPTIGYDKRRKKRKSGVGVQEDEEETGSAGEQAPLEPSQERIKPPSRPPSRAGSRAGSVPRDSVPPSHPAHFLPPEPLEEIPETEDEELPSGPGPDASQESVEPPPRVKPRGVSKDRPPPSRSQQRDQSKGRTSPYSGTSSKALNQLEAQRHSTPVPRGIGSFLGRIVHWLATSVIRRIVQVIALIFFLVWTLIAGIFRTIIIRPIAWVSNGTSNATRDFPVKNLARVIIFAILIGLIGFVLNPSSDIRSSMSELVWSMVPVRNGRTYHAPPIPPESVEDIVSRLSQVENALASLASAVSSKEQQSQKQSQRALDQVHSRLETEAQRAREAEERFRTAAAQGLTSLRNELEKLQSEWVRVYSAASKNELQELQERVVTVESNAREALDLAKKTEGGTDVKWRSKWSTESGVTIRSSDGQDVSALIGSMVDQAASRFYKDGIAKPDFALYSAGARIIPHLTSNTYEVKPKSWSRYIIGSITGNGYAMGLPPVWALHPDVHVGNCWPFRGSRGQIGIVLARNVFISEVTIEHTPKDVAYDVRAAPRQMELWGLVQGADNIAKVRDYQRAVKERREEIVRRAKAESVEPPPDDDAYPPSLPQSPHYIRLAQFTYNVHASDHLQTFDVSQEVQDIGADFGIVVLIIKNNWGEEDYTCLYRVRVHGVEKDRRPFLLPEQDSP